MLVSSGERAVLVPAGVLAGGVPRRRQVPPVVVHRRQPHGGHTQDAAGSSASGAYVL
jgi:hypothetical protein